MRQRFGFSCLLLTVTLLMLQGQAAVIRSSEQQAEIGLYWGPWSAWTNCSRPCGGGVEKRTRTSTCLVDDSSDGEGSLAQKNDVLCPGNSREYRSCNIQPCKDSTDFRELQCSLFNSEVYLGKHLDWLPYTHHDNNNTINPCALNCYPDGEDFYRTLSESVIDGTPCSDNPLNPAVCADGNCLEMGCDGQINSSLRYDECGVCGGNGSSCFSHEGKYNYTVNAKGYYPIAVIEEGATNIHVQQTKLAKSYLAIQDANNTNHYYLNGNWTVDPPGLYHIAGTVFNYKRESTATRHLGKGSLYAQGPTTRPLVIYMLAWALKNHGFNYSYSTPIEYKKRCNPDCTWKTWRTDVIDAMSLPPSPKLLTVNPQKKKKENVVPPTETPVVSPSNNPGDNSIYTPQWKEGPFGSCSKSCGGGIKTAEHHCQQGLQIVADSECSSVVKPVNRKKKCRAYDCPPSWELGPWSSCTKTCGGGTRTRKVKCWQTTVTGPDEKQPSKFCSTVQPATRESCNLGICWGVWEKAKWEPCTKGCGHGDQKRRVYCVDSATRKEQNDTKCDVNTKPKEQKDCYNRQHCNKTGWYTDPLWGPCSVTCGQGFETRAVVCYGSQSSNIDDRKILEDGLCDPTTKPETTKSCTKPICPPQWVIGNWTNCTKTCTGGTQLRTVECMYNGKPAVDQCDYEVRPFEIRECNKHLPCTKRPSECVDRKQQYCALFKIPPHNKRGLCKYIRNRRICCKTCHDMDEDY